MLTYLKNLKWIFLFIPFLPSSLTADNFNYNSYNNHGSVGLVNMPTARMFDEGVFGVTIYDGTPDQKITITASPYNWLEASFFYTNIQNKRYCPYLDIFICRQDYKDKGFNVKVRLKEEGIFPAIAVGVNDLAGTGLYSAEYIVGSYGINNLDIHFGLGWGALNGSSKAFKNPLSYIHDSFNTRPYDNKNFKGQGGQFQPQQYFSGETSSPFFGASYAINEDTLIKLEYDTTKTDGIIQFESPSSRTSIGLDYNINNNFTVGLSLERDNYFSLRFIYKKNTSLSTNEFKYESAPEDENLNKYGRLISNLNQNGIGVNKIYEGAASIGLEITQFKHTNLDLIEEIVYLAKQDSGIIKEIKKQYMVADLDASSEYDDDYIRNSKLIYERETQRNFVTSSKFNIRPFLAAREGFFKVAALVENNSEYIIKDNFFFSSNLKYSIKDNFEDLYLQPVDTFPAQVRSDIKQYLRNLEGRVVIGRAQFDYHINPTKNNHIMFTAGILEEMFNGYGFEYLHFDSKKNYAVGFELFDVKKRDYDLRFGTLDYKTTTGHLNFYYRNYGIIPFDAKISYGKYLAGDIGSTFELSRSYRNGAKFGVFASFTDVTTEQFGEGSFDKGLFFSIPLYKNFLDYTWRPLTKDPGAKLLRKHTLHGLLVRFQPYNE
jgi:hypothetical protein